MIQFKKNDRFMIGAAIFIVFIILLSGLYYAFMYFGEDDDTKVEPPEMSINDQISPYTNQGLIVEMLRIRNRNLMDHMLIQRGPGRAWKNPPSYYYIATVDGKEGNVEGNVGRNGVFTEWDNIGNENHMSYFIPEEQGLSDITITIVEKTSSGIFGKTTDVEKETIYLTYDYRTGRWTGDDYFQDQDGYGHYLGDTYEVWFNLYQSDYDHDGIPFWIEENILNTDPTIDDSTLDPDNDGIPTSWEWKWGYDPFTWDDHEHLDPDIDGIENIEEYKMRKYFANPYQPEMYIETDGMEQKRRFEPPHIFPKEAQQMIIERFAQHGIWVYIDDGWADGPMNGGGEMVPYHELVDDIVGRQMISFYTNNFADERKGIFRYVVVGNERGGFANPCSYNMMDAIHIGTSWYETIRVRSSFCPRAYKFGIAKAVLHELGHTCGLVPVTFPGNDINRRNVDNRYPSMPDEEYEQYVEKYHSIMNYNYINRDRLLFDYSDGSNGAPYDQDDWAFIYIPSFQVDMVSYEEPVDESFEDFEVVNDYPGIMLDGWTFDENLSYIYTDDLVERITVKNTDVFVRIYVQNKVEDGRQKIRVYAMPEVEPVHAVWSLVRQGWIDNDDTIYFYDIDKNIDEFHPLR